jgi:hypothetical protein
LQEGDPQSESIPYTIVHIDWHLPWWHAIIGIAISHRSSRSIIGINIEIYHHCMLLSESASTVVAVPYWNQHRHIPSLHVIIVVCYYWKIGINISIYHHCMLLSESASTTIAVPYWNQHRIYHHYMLLSESASTIGINHRCSPLPELTLTSTIFVPYYRNRHQPS